MAEPGWRTDPTGRFEQRWFDGRRWTKRIRVGEAEAIDTLGVRNDLQPPPEREGAAPEWRDDPDDPGQERFFDGRGWTAATRDRRADRPRSGIRDWPLPRIVVIVLAVLGIVAAGAVVLTIVL